MIRLPTSVSVFPLNRLLYGGSLALSADETQAYVAMDLVTIDGALAVLDLQTGAVARIPVGYSSHVAAWARAHRPAGIPMRRRRRGEPPAASSAIRPAASSTARVCDANCTTGCGNGIASGTEQCDDGNTNNNDACKNDCTPNVCGDGFVYRGVEQCDHGALNGTPGDACSATCALAAAHRQRPSSPPAAR